MKTDKKEDKMSDVDDNKNKKDADAVLGNWVRIFLTYQNALLDPESSKNSYVTDAIMQDLDIDHPPSGCCTYPRQACGE